MIGKKNKAQLVVALDIDSFEKMRVLVDQLADVVEIFKVGSQLFTACGPAAVRFIEARGKKVFLDLKFHDIPNTVGSAVRSAVGLSVALERATDFHNRTPSVKKGLFMYSVHTVGGLEMMKEAVAVGTKFAEEIGVNKPLAMGVTVLTSEANKGNSVIDLVLERAAVAKKAGLDGVVASAEEAKAIHDKLGKDFLIITPGIRPLGTDPQDQKRVATPKIAVKNGSDFLVVGRPIVAAANPHKAAEAILQEMQSS